MRVVVAGIPAIFRAGGVTSEVCICADHSHTSACSLDVG